MSEIKKNISVCARIRPVVEGDDASSASSSSSSAVSISGNRVTLNDQGQAKTFDIDTAYDGTVSNSQLFTDQIDPLIPRLLTGYHAFIIAYGAGRTGKSYTLFGANDSEGIIDQTADAIFQRLESMSNTCKSFVSVSVFDVYNAQIIDLLNPNTKTGLNLLEHRSFGCYVENLAELECVNSNEVKSYVKQAMAVHDVLELRMTNQLGKPHTFIDLHVEIIENDNPSTIKFSTLRFCAVAGSGGVSLKFNAGLQALNKVIDALASDKESWNIPYSSSRLTRLLEPGLGGNSSAIWIANIDASERNIPDTIHSLEVAEKIRRIKNTARVNKNTIANTIRELREEIKKARGKLQLTQPGTYMHDIDPQQLKNLKQLITELDRIKSHTWEKKHQKSILANEQRRISLETEGLLYTLTEAKDIDIPEQMLKQSKSLLANLVAAKSALEDAEMEVAEKRNLVKMRLETVQKKWLNEQKANDDGSAPANLSVADLTKSDEKLQKLDRALHDSEDKSRLAQLDVLKLEEEYRKILTKITTIEMKQRKIFLMGKDQMKLEKLNKAHEWSSMKKEMDTPSSAVAREIQTINQNIDTQKQAVNDANDVNQMREVALSALETSRTASLNAKQSELERDTLWGKLIEQQFKHEIQMNRYQEHMFFVSYLQLFACLVVERVQGY